MENANPNKSKRVSVFKDGVKVAVYPSIGQAAKAIGIGHTTIANIANGSRGAYRGLSFQFAQEDERIFMPTTPIAIVDQRPPRQGRGFPVVAFKNGALVGRYKTLSECAEALGVNSGGISSALRGIQHTVKGYTFAYDLEGKCQRKPLPLPLTKPDAAPEKPEEQAQEQSQEQDVAKIVDVPGEMGGFISKTHKEMRWGAEQAFPYLEHEASWEKGLLTDALNWYDRTIKTLVKSNPDKMDIVRIDDKIDDLYYEVKRIDNIYSRLHKLETAHKALSEFIESISSVFVKMVNSVAKC